MGHAVDMATQNYFSHTSLDGRSPWDRIDEAGYPHFGAGENIAAGQRTAEDVVTAWLNSPGHCRNIMNPSFDELGVGYAYDAASTYQRYWVQNFGIVN